jgi:hypothetical protein
MGLKEKGWEGMDGVRQVDKCDVFCITLHLASMTTSEWRTHTSMYEDFHSNSSMNKKKWCTDIWMRRVCSNLSKRMGIPPSYKFCYWDNDINLVLFNWLSFTNKCTKIIFH